MTAPTIRLVEASLHERQVVLRLPFRFGVTTLRAAPLAFVRVRIRIDGGAEAVGYASELMVPKWFDKSPELSNDDNFEQLRKALRLTATAYATARSQTAFRLASRMAPDLWRAGEAHGLPGLVLGFGPALLDRAILDALCRALNLSFFDAINRDLPGFAREDLPDDLADFDMARFAARLRPAASLAARHTVGMSDPITRGDVDAPLEDGLPETLEEVIAVYGQDNFKVKVRGELDADLERLHAIAALLDRAENPYVLTLDGNEQYADAAQVEGLLDAIDEAPALRRLRAAILFLEQPLARKDALIQDVTSLGARLPVLIDESDADLSAFRIARDRGYAGVSSKDCKGVYRALLNTARCAAWAGDGRPAYFMSAEDLTCPSGLAVQQDLALAALIGVGHVERNGHHYIAGIPAAPDAERDAFLAAHPDLYDRRDGRIQLRIQQGRIALGSLAGVGMGSPCTPWLEDGVSLL